jgi:predicted DNA-binding protein (MmcQ/YjbR family)
VGETICSSALAKRCLPLPVSDAKVPTKLSFKCTPEKFSELVEQEGIIPAPYVARYHWVALEDLDALSQQS